MNTAFVDLYNGKTININEIMNTLNKYFETNKYDLCVNNELSGKFGKHVIIQTDKIEYQKDLYSIVILLYLYLALKL